MCYTKLYLYSILIGDNDLVIALFLGMKFTLDDVVVQNNVSFDDFSLLTYFPYIERDLDGISGILFSTLDSKKYLMTYSSVAFAVPEYSLKKDIYESGYICYLS